MKKLGKLSINPEKVIKNEELVNLRGGYHGTCEGADAYCCVIRLYEGGPLFGPGTVCVAYGGDVGAAIDAAYPEHGTYVCSHGNC